MNALVYDGTMRLIRDYPKPTRGVGDALIRVRVAGICATDLEIVRGYMGFRGVLGHEFVGEVEEADDADWLGRRVVGEINCGCGTCSYCLRGLERHCPSRSVLGILDRDGAFAEYLTLPLRNLHVVPDAIPDEEAVFTEPLAAALEIPEQVPLRPTDEVAVLGDGRLGSLIAQVLHLFGCSLLVVGRHEEKLAILRQRGIATGALDEVEERSFDLVVEATGSAEGLQTAIGLTRPRGTVVLKSTVASTTSFDTARLVVDEITVVGSRCGPFEPALRLLEQRSVDVRSMISATFPLTQGEEAMEYAARRDALKVLLYT